MIFIPFSMDKTKDTSKRDSNIYITINTIFVILFVKKNPYSTEYNVTGTLSQLIDGSLISNITFVPVCGSRALKTIFKEMKNSSTTQIIRDFPSPLAKESFLQKQVSPKLPLFINSWPSFSFNEENISFGIRN